MQNKPQKRHEALQPLSREHHHGLLLSWKIKTGIKKHAAPERIANYANWFYENYLLQHFETEEKYVFPVLGSHHPLIIQATEEHKQIRELFSSGTVLPQNLHSLADLVEKHIRFEERVVFNEIEKVASAQQLQIIQGHHSESAFCDNLADIFWR